MAISSSLYASISGLSTMGEAMSVLGDNVSNVNTAAFKSSRSTFQDVLSQSVSTAAGGAQVGRGVTLSTINSLFAQGSFESSSSPTDMAIGGQGFFMLRANGSAEADMYSRAGEFGFDQSGNLVNPMGYFAQGWTIDSTTGQAKGTIGDINIGKNTPPVATTNVEVIANVDSRIVNEETEDRLFANWNGSNVAGPTPSAPIASDKYDYTTSVKVYDSKGASHDLTVFFDRTTKDNQWEFLVTCDPTEDQRVMTAAEQVTYNPDTRYNYQNHQGAGALLYGTLQFDTSGNIASIDAFKVPPDGQVDPAKTDNRLLLEAGSSYFSFPANFNGADTNQETTINFGARYDGKTKTLNQTLVSDAGALDGADPITSATLWSNVSDENGKTIMQGDQFIFEGYNNNSDPVTKLVYTVDPGKDIQDLLTQLEQTFNCTAKIDGQGRLQLADNTGGDSSMFVTRFETISVNDATPFGGSTANTIDNAYSITDTGITSDGQTVVTDDGQSLIGLQGENGAAIVAGDTFTFSGTDIENNAVGPAVFTVGDPNMDTIADLLAFLNTTFNAGNATGVESVLDQEGRLRVVDTTGSTRLAVNAQYDMNPLTPPDGVSDPFGLVDGAAADTLTAKTAMGGEINITTAKEMVVSNGRAFSANTGDTTPISAATQWSSVYDDNSDPTMNGGLPRTVSENDSFTFAGTNRDGTPVTSTFTVAYTLSDGSPGTIQDLLDKLERDFGCDASIDNAGRLVLTDRTADSVGSASELAIGSITYAYTADARIAGEFPDIFGAGAFAIIPADIASEDGSQQGDVVTTNFSPEALSSTQYANSSTTIFQDQDGFASGFLQSVSTDVQGVITGHYSNGQVLKKAQVALANFSNLAGLKKQGGNIFVETTNSGAPVTGAPGTNGLGSIAPNALEQSNVDLGIEFVKLITVQRGFQANSKIITTTDDMLNELINIKR